MLTMEDAKSHILGKKVVSFEANPDCDEGFVLILDDGSTLRAGWSGCEGELHFNGMELYTGRGGKS